MRGITVAAAWLGLFSAQVRSLKYDEAYVGYNLNENPDATNPMEYWGKWENHDFHPSPDNWRFPFYTLFLDKFVNGDPTNDNINGTLFEHDMMQTQLRHGGDLQGLIDSLDYIYGMGVRALYIAGGPMINQPWGADMYSPLDMTLLDAHNGDIAMWRKAVQAIHDHGMYVILDNTVSTMGDLIAFDGYLNESTPFKTDEHKVQWRNERRQYHDFRFGNEYNQTCHYPRFWLETGYIVKEDVTDQFSGCYDSDFDQYGDTEAFGVFPDWQRQLSKFASVQDRLREWVPSVNERIARFACLWITMLDIDGIRLDKATQVTVDALADFSKIVRECARKEADKQNFFINGEITGGNTFGAIYIGRGRQPDMVPANDNITEAVLLNRNSSLSYFIRDADHVPLDSATFHYSIYRSLTRFLGMSGNLAAGYDIPVDWVKAWRMMLVTNDMINPNTGVFDPRHMYGTTNQDVFRWPAIDKGTERMLLGMFVTTLLLPGIPLLLWGEEQAFYALDNTAANYVFGRQSMSSAFAWELHGCYTVGSAQYRGFNPVHASNACKDEWNSHDHRDPTHPVRNIIKAMNQMRQNYPVLNDGWYLQEMSKQTHEIKLPGSDHTATEFGIWSVLRSQFPDGIQVLNNTYGQGDQSVWLLYHNDNVTTTYNFNCNSDDPSEALIVPFPGGTTLKNLYYPYQEVTLKNGRAQPKINDGKTMVTGCLDSVEMEPYAFRAFVPKAKFVKNGPMMTGFSPGHDARLVSTANPGEQETIPIEFHYSAEMKCTDFRTKIEIASKTEDGTTPEIDQNSVQCGVVPAEVVPGAEDFVGTIPTTWKFKANLIKVSNGIHSLTLRNLTTDAANGGFTDSIDKVFFRVGQQDNPIIFPRLANYTRALLSVENGELTLNHKAAGADMYRYSTNWGSSWSDWEPYVGGSHTIKKLPWSGTKRQEWAGDHVELQYFSAISGSSDYFQHGDSDPKQPARRLPHLFAHGPFNLYGYDNGILNKFDLNETSGAWEYNFMTEWPGVLQLNVWGMNPDGRPDESFVFGDLDNDGVLDRMPPSSLTTTLINITEIPAWPHLGYRVILNDGDYRYGLEGYGSQTQQKIIAVLLWIIPIITGALSIWLFMKSFYAVKFNKVGISESHSLVPLALRRAMKRSEKGTGEKEMSAVAALPMIHAAKNGSNIGLDLDAGAKGRRTVLIATMEYDIEDWDIKIKIGGLGVMAQLMGKNLGHQDLIWVVPCVGGIDYPEDQRAEPMHVTILGISYVVEVQYHTLRNITYVLLDAPVFRAQSKLEPYPARMDDLDSAVYYSAWNQCIALAVQRFPVDLYHINDYHGAVAPLHLLPQTIPCCLSLHNAEFQGLWPMRTNKEKKEVCAVYNLPEDVVLKYVQFGDVFNLLHAASSYLRIHQKGFGAVGVSAKYGKRSWARYPIFWGLSKIGKLPNPDPSDTGDWSGHQDTSEVVVNANSEAQRGDLRRQAQQWAGLDINPNADLLVFVGRWSMQKGIDLIADVMPAVLEENPNVQLICVGPVIDLYGKFAALKLDVLMRKYRGRVFSKPEFTALPPFIFSGAEFALIPSRDEPFGLVAVEFGRKGALGIGARVGGLGQMPGWWYTVESTTTTHLLHQFKMAIKDALSSKLATRQMMRARSAKQRFPVVQWVNDLETLQTKSISIHEREAMKGLSSAFRDEKTRSFLRPKSLFSTPNTSSLDVRSRMFDNPNASMADLSSYAGDTRPSTPTMIEPPPSGLGRKLSLGYKSGPGHSVPRRRFQGNTLSVADSIGDDGMSEIDEDEREYRRGDDEYVVSAADLEAERIREQQARAHSPGAVSLTPTAPNFPFSDSPSASPRGRPLHQYGDEGLGAPSHLRHPHSPGIRSPSSNGGGSPGPEDILLPPSIFGGPAGHRASTLSLNSVVGDKTDFNLQKVDPFFTDTQGEYYREFEKSLQNLDAKNSETTMCIEDYLVKSEKKWFNKFRDAKLGRGSATPSKVGTPTIMSRRSSIDSFMNDGPSAGHPLQNSSMVDEGGSGDQFYLGNDYKPPTGLRLFMQYRLGTWPVYSFLLAFGQIIAANSYQITLLSGTVGQTASRLYVTASIYLAFSIVWWGVFVKLKSVYVLSIPFIFYGLAFFMLGMAPFVGDDHSREWMQNIATGFYAIAAASGSVFFALNFGDEGGAPIKDWAFRACMIQGSQQVYVCALWFWGDYLTRRQADGRGEAKFNTGNIYMTAVTVPIAVLMWAIGAILFTGLPDYYRQAPGKVPSFYASLLRRKIILWFFVYVIIQNFFLSTLYGRNWLYLFSSRHAEIWHIVILIVVFFGFVWAGFLWLFGSLSKDHSWIIPIFAIGLGAPRWAQMLWSCTPLGQYVPWMGSPLASALFSRSLWLWLGTLDAIQGVGFGMILLQTLTRLHICFTLLAAQVFGSITTICARAFAPNNVGPGDVFPDFTMGIYPGIEKPWFWVGLIAQFVICAGFFTFFRKEQLSKP